LRVEQLEDRRVPAVITVTTVTDDITPNDGTVSLREAITAINAGNDLGDPDITAQSPGTFGVNDTINFNITGAGVQTINVGTDASATGIPLPTIVKPVTINGYTQTGASVNTMANSDNAVLLIQLNGPSAGAGSNGLTLGAGSGGSTIKGLDITNFLGDGIVIQSNGNTIVGNFVGVNPAGTTRMPNGSFPNTGDGILIQNAFNNLIGTPAAADRNIASGNAIDGIHVVGTLTAPATGNLIQNNFVGVAADGKSTVGNRTEPAPAPGAPEGNNLFGIEISGGNINTVGGTVAGARNVVGFNGAGIEVDNGGQGNIIQGNFSGVGADGVTPVGNLLHGIVLRSSNGFSAPLGPAQPNEPGVSYNLIGGTVAGAGNLVEFNGTGGIAVFGNPVSASGQPNIGNAIEGNSVFENGRSFATASSKPTPLLGIDLTNGFLFPRDDGFTANDAKGHNAPNDPNNFQNFPVLTSATVSGSTTTITGTLKASPNSTYRIEFFANDTDPLGQPAEGQQFLGFINVTTDGSGNASFSAPLNVAVATGRLVTATATDAIGNTSEFSVGLTVPTFLTTPPPFVSVAFGPGGQVTLLTLANGTLLRFDAAGTHVLGGGVRAASVAFNGGSEVDVIAFQNGALIQLDASGGRSLVASGVGAASVAFGPAGEVLLVTLTNGSLVQLDATGVRTLGTNVGSASVAFGPIGEVIVETLLNGTLLQLDASGVRALTTSVRSAGVSFVAGTEVLDVIFQDNTLVQFDSTGRHLLGVVG
jgi:CSLREA domain-containing protein